MSNSSIPPYKPPQELQDILDKQAGLRKRTAKLPTRDWIHRNPRKFHISFVTASLLILFSKPLYDILFSPSVPAIEDPISFKNDE